MLSTPSSSLTATTRLRTKLASALALVALWAVPNASAAPKPAHRRLDPTTLSAKATKPLVVKPALSVIGNVWASRGPGSLNATGLFSGRIAGVAADPTDPNTILIAAAGGGVWKTTDGGKTWASKTDFMPSLNMGSIAISSHNSQYVYAGTGEGNNSEDSRAGHGLLISTDGGDTWTVTTGNSGELDRVAISKIAIDPNNEKTVYVATSAATNGVSSFGVYKSTDGGATWTNTTAALGTGSGFSDVAVDPSNSNIVYAAIGDVFTTSNNGLFKSSDGGATWALTGLTQAAAGVLGRISFSIAPSASSVIFAAVHDGSGNGLLGVYKSTDSGATFTKQASCPDFTSQQAWYNLTIAVSPLNPNTIFACGSSNIGVGNVESTDGGKTWNTIDSSLSGTPPHTDVHALTFNASDQLLNGNDGGLFLLTNPSPSAPIWADLNSNLDTIQFTGVALNPTISTIAFGGSQDNGTERWVGSKVWTEVAGGDGGFVRVNQNDGSRVFHTYSGVSLERSTDGGTNWVDITPSAALLDGSEFYPPYNLDPLNQNRLLFGTTNIYESYDGGTTFHTFATAALNGFNAPGYPVRSLAIRGQITYAITYNGVYITTNAGISWYKPVVAPASFSFQDVATDSTGTTAVIVCSRYTGSSSGHVYLTTNSGLSWTDIGATLPDTPVNAVTIDPADGTIYIGTDQGIFLSSDSGTTWYQFGSALPNVSVVNLALNPQTSMIAAGTHGRGMWTITLPPRIIQVTPTTGTAASTVTITGSNLTNATNVSFNGVAATITTNTTSTIVVTVPPFATSGYISVTTPGGTAYSPTIFNVSSSPLSLMTISPSAVFAGSNSFTLSAMGTGFVSGAGGTSQIQFDGVPSTTNANSNGTLSTLVPASVVANAGTPQVSVINPDGTVSNSLPLSVTYPVPGITSISPTTIVKGSGATTLTVYGKGFFNTSQISLTGTPVTTTLGTAVVNGQTVPVLTCTVPASLTLATGLIAVTVTNPTPNGGTSLASTLSIVNPTASLLSIVPSEVSVLSNPFTLVATGTNFQSGATISVSTTTLPTTLNADKTLSATVPTSSTISPGYYPVTVLNPAPVGGPSTESVMLAVDFPIPALTTVTPISIVKDTPSTTLVATGTGIYGGSQIAVNGTPQKTIISSSKLVTTLTAAQVSSIGPLTITIVNPTPGGGTSQSLAVKVIDPLPVITGLTPSFTTALTDLKLKVAGTGLLSGTHLAIGSKAYVSTLDPDGTLTAFIPGTDLPVSGTYLVTVTTPPPGGSASLPATLTVVNPIPTLTSISPTSMLAGSADFTVTVTGTNFIAASQIAVGGAAVPTTFDPATRRLTATIPAADVKNAGSLAVSVANPGPGGGATLPSSIQILNPIPGIASYSPTTVPVGSTGTKLTVRGRSFVSTSVVNLNGQALATVLNSDGSLTAVVPDTLTATTGSLTLTVTNPAPGGGTSKPMTFAVVNPVPTITSVNPTKITAGTRAFTIAITGSALIPGSQIILHTSAGTLYPPTTYNVNSTLTATVPATAAATAGLIGVSVSNPAPGGGSSNGVYVNVNNPIPGIISVTPTTALAGSASVKLTVTGVGFIAGSTQIIFDNAPLTTTVSNGVLTATVPSTVLRTARTVNMYVRTSSPGGGLSSAVPFHILYPVPVIKALYPAQVTAGLPFTLVIAGTGFVSNPPVRVGSQVLASTLNANGTLTVKVAAISAGAVGVTVTNPTPGGGSSSPATLSVVNPAPSIISLSPNKAGVGSSAFTLGISGRGIINGVTTIAFNSLPLSGTVDSAGVLRVVVPATALTKLGSVSVTLTNPGPGGGTSASVTFTIK